MNRRKFLGGAGPMIARPFSASLVPGRARGADPMRKNRFIAVYVPCGINMVDWTPVDEGPNWTLSPILTPLEPFRSPTLVLRAANTPPGRSDGGGDHAAGTGAFLTCTHVYKTTGADIHNGTSLDQLLAPTLSD